MASCGLLAAPICVLLGPGILGSVAALSSAKHTYESSSMWHSMAVTFIGDLYLMRWQADALRQMCW